MSHYLSQKESSETLMSQKESSCHRQQWAWWQVKVLWWPCPPPSLITSTSGTKLQQACPQASMGVEQIMSGSGLLLPHSSSHRPGIRSWQHKEREHAQSLLMSVASCSVASFWSSAILLQRVSPSLPNMAGSGHWSTQNIYMQLINYTSTLYKNVHFPFLHPPLPQVIKYTG